MHQNTYIVIPVFNEQQTIKKVVESILPYNYSVVLVDDGSTDRSVEIIRALPVYYLQHLMNLGQGAALQTGITFALFKGAEYIITFDGDGQHAVSDVENLLLPLKNEEVDIVFGSRFKGGSFTNMSAGRKMMITIARWINYLFTGFLLSDAHNGLRAMNKKAAASIQIKEQGMAHASEILFQVKKINFVFAKYRFLSCILITPERRASLLYMGLPF